MSRAIAAILFILILIGAITLGFVFFKSNTKVKVLTITSQGKFDPGELKITNDEVLKIENKDGRKHSVRNLATDSNIVTDLDAGKTSGEIVFDNNSRNQLALVDNKDITTNILVGNAPAGPQVTQTPSTTTSTKKTTTPATSTNKQTASNKPLPNTGPKNLYVYPLILLFGLLAFLVTGKLVPTQFAKYQVRLGKKTFLIRQAETTLVQFPLKK